MVVVQLPGMALIYRPCFTAIEWCRENYVPVHLDLGLLGGAPPVPDVLVESAEGDTSFCKSSIHLVVIDNVSGERAAKVGELVHRVQFLPADAYAWFKILLAWSSLMQHFRLLCTDCQAEIVACVRELVHAVLHGGFRGSVEGTVVGKQEVVDGV